MNGLMKLNKNEAEFIGAIKIFYIFVFQLISCLYRVHACIIRFEIIFYLNVTYLFKENLSNGTNYTG